MSTVDRSLILLKTLPSLERGQAGQRGREEEWLLGAGKVNYFFQFIKCPTIREVDNTILHVNCLLYEGNPPLVPVTDHLVHDLVYYAGLEVINT